MVSMDMFHELFESLNALQNAPTYHLLFEAGLIAWLMWLLFRPSYNPHDRERLTRREEQELIDEWTPEPLVPATPQDSRALHPRIVSGKVGKYIQIGERNCLNLGTNNYLGMIENPEIEKSALECLSHYGVGSCGPRGFYGTTEVHLDLEDKLAEYMKCEEAVVYSYGFSTIASAIPAYAKRSDVIFVDEMVNFAIQKGLDASRSQINYFKHNDMEDLERLLMEQADLDRKNPKKAKRTRRFLVAEGIYMNTGLMAPLPKLLELREKYKLRFFLDEAISFGTIGKTGHGLTEHFNIDPSEIDMISGSLENSIGSIGGFCVGSHFIIEHQRLSGLGYCFSASAPPLLMAAAITALDIMQRDPSIFQTLRDNSTFIHSQLSSQLPSDLRVHGHPESVIKHIRLANPSGDKVADEQLLNEIVEKVLAARGRKACDPFLETEDLPTVTHSTEFAGLPKLLHTGLSERIRGSSFSCVPSAIARRLISAGCITTLSWLYLADDTVAFSSAAGYFWTPNAACAPFDTAHVDLSSTDRA